MAEARLWVLAMLLLAVPACRTPRHKSAEDVAVGLQEARRAFLYSRIDRERLLELARPSADQKAADRLYVFDQRTSRLREVVTDDGDRLKDLDGSEALIGLSVEEHGPSINLWNWIEGRIDTLALRLDSLYARSVETDGASKRFEVVFTAAEPALFPFSTERDYEIYKALLEVTPEGNCARLLKVRQLTFNRWDDTSPAFSPDGNWIVFVTERLGPGNIALMDSQGEFLRLLTREKAVSSRHPVVLPDNSRCLYVAGPDGAADFYVCGLDGRGHRRASSQELKKMLFSWDDATRHKYLITESFSRRGGIREVLELPPRLDLVKLLLLAEHNSPRLRKYREKIRAARAEADYHQRRRGPAIALGATHMLDTGTFVSEPDISPGDRSVEGFTRYLLSLSVPLFTGSLDEAVRQQDLWQAAVYSQTYRMECNDLAHRVVREFYNYSEQEARVRVLRRILDLNLRRKFLWDRRIKAGQEMPGKSAEAAGYVQETRAELEAARGKAQQARSRLLAAAGLQESEALRITPAPLDWEEIPWDVPPVERLQALAQVNHPDLDRLRFLELRAAAVRDMGAPETRRRPALQVHYGLGEEHLFSEVVDDFISLGLSHTIPLEKIGLEKSYAEQWTHEMLSYRRERRQAVLDVNSDLRTTFEALGRIREHFRSARKWRDHADERLRVSRIYHAGGALPSAEMPDVSEPIDAQIEYLRQVMALIEARSDFCRRLARYYHRAGLGSRLLSVLQRTEEPAQRRHRSLFLWHSLETVLHPAKREQLLRTCTRHGITRIYCFVSRVENSLYLRKHHWEFGYFLDLCRKHGIEVHALVGNPRWVRPSYRGEIGALLRSIVEFNAREQGDQAGFSGVQVDVELHALPGWRDPEKRQRLAEQYLETLDYVRAQLGREGEDLRLSAAVPYTWADVEMNKGDLFREACARLDEVTLMAYRDSAEEIVGEAAPLLKAAEQTDTPVEVAVETAPVPQEGISFAGSSMEELMVALDRVWERLSPRPGFRGFALHDYAGLRKLIEADHGH